MITPVVVWGALPFHRAAWTNLRHGAATMDTLVSMGTLAAFVGSRTRPTHRALDDAVHAGRQRQAHQPGAG